MKLRFEIPILNIEIFRVSLDFERGEEESLAETVVDKVVSGTSKWWVSRMFKK